MVGAMKYVDNNGSSFECAVEIKVWLLLDSWSN